MGEETDIQPDATTTPVERPAGNASQEVWATYAISKGMDPTEAQEMSRDELRELYKQQIEDEIQDEEEREREEAAREGGRRIKYMGSSDVRQLRAGETAMETMPKINRTITWDINNYWIVNTADFPEVSEKWWDHLVAYDDFEDVTDVEGSPLNRHQEVFLAMKKVPGQREPAPGEFPTRQPTTGQDAVPDFFDSRAAEKAAKAAASKG